MATTTAPEMVLVSKEELERLRRLEADLPAIVEKAKDEERKDALVRLHTRDKENPDNHRQRSNKYYSLHKDEIKIKRREAYLRKKAATAMAAQTPGFASALAENSPDPM